MTRRIFTFVAWLCIAIPTSQGAIAPRVSVAEPALQQCIEGVFSHQSSSDEDVANAPPMSDCIGVGSNACVNDAGDSSTTTVLGCDEDERSFWAKLVAFTTTELDTSLSAAGKAALAASASAWTPWLEARCAFVRASMDDAEQSELQTSWCVMETTGERAIDLIAALPATGG